jgi:hypothetical protein
MFWYWEAEFDELSVPDEYCIAYSAKGLISDDRRDSALLRLSLK